MNDYYQKIFYLAQVDKNDKVMGKIERWECHKKGILHRGFTAILIVENMVVLQKRRHPVFDGYWDISFSSHPIYENGQLQDDKEAVLKNLKREWIIKEKIKEDNIIYLDKFYYQAKDEKSGLIEHEIDYLYLIKIKEVPHVNQNYGYDMKMVDKNLLTDIDKQDHILKKFKLVPWVKLGHYQRFLQ